MVKSTYFPKGYQTRTTARCVEIWLKEMSCMAKEIVTNSLKLNVRRALLQKLSINRNHMGGLSLVQRVTKY